ncbi:MAG: DNA repair protein RecN [Gammaproteobacteria bacterium]|nr:DNA repair protein RecN [Gammaproteobacteria bacterium]
MLNHLLIRNLAVVDEVEVEPGKGLTVLTGETGAGKSILVDALALALGERADSDAVRPGAPRAEVAASFSVIPGTAAAAWLDKHDLEDTDSDACVVRRIVTPEGRSRGYINGNPVPMQLLRELGERLVDICGQQAHQSLGRPDTQRAILDQHGGHAALLAEVRAAYNEWRRLQAEHDELDGARADQRARLELLRFQVAELDALNVQPGEFAELEIAHRLAANSARLLSGVGAALAQLYEGNSDDQPTAQDLLSAARNELTDLSELDPELNAAATLLSEAEIQVSEAADALRHYLLRDELAGADLPALESRLSALLETARKHRIDPTELDTLTTTLRTQLEGIENADDTLAALAAAVQTAGQHLQALCDKLSKRRRKSAKLLEQRVVSNIRDLGMPEGDFKIHLEALPAPGPHGGERVEFQVALNPGMRIGPLTKIASGGELSRVSLAVQVAASSQSATPTLIFDEVDAGVGGGTADIVGTQLRSLAATSQVLCVTHLPQVASKGHGHFRVSKLSDGKATRTRVVALNRDERIDELARMLGGVEITERTRAHAEEMLDAADRPQRTG